MEDTQSVDALSEALSSVRMTGAIFYDAICTAPWGFSVPNIRDVAHVLAPGAEHLVGFHLVADGRAVVRFEGASDVALAAGDVVIIPHGDTHTVSNGRPSALVDSRASIAGNLAGDLCTHRIGGAGDATRFVCGYFSCERHATRSFLAGLPRIVKINIRNHGRGAWLESSIRHLLAESSSGRPGRKALLSKMAEALFIETLRLYVESLPSEATGWLAGARDPLVGAALAHLHRNPDRAWTLAELANEVGAARSLVAERFARFMGETPMRYLARWRLQLAARLLQTTRRRVIKVALDAGYDSETAFNRAFKREFGLPPGRYRKAHSGTAARPQRAPRRGVERENP